MFAVAWRGRAVWLGALIAHTSGRRETATTAGSSGSISALRGMSSSMPQCVVWACDAMHIARHKAHEEDRFCSVHEPHMHAAHAHAHMSIIISCRATTSHTHHDDGGAWSGRHSPHNLIRLPVFSVHASRQREHHTLNTMHRAHPPFKRPHLFCWCVCASPWRISRICQRQCVATWRIQQSTV